MHSRRSGEAVLNWVRAHTKQEFDQFVDILDLGCGDGRVAGAFARHNSQLRYLGLEINAEWVRRLNSNFRGTNFRFTHADIFHSYYNTRGQNKAEDYIFPYPEASFDLVIAHAVFGHLHPAEVQNYLVEIRKVLRQDSLCWCTLFLHTEQDISSETDAQFKFRFDLGDFRTIDEQRPESLIAFSELAIREMIKSAGLQLERLIYGSWHSPKKRHYDLNVHNQDVILLRKS